MPHASSPFVAAAAPLVSLRRQLEAPIKEIMVCSEAMKSDAAATAGYPGFAADMVKISEVAGRILTLINDQLTEQRLVSVNEIVRSGVGTAAPFPFSSSRLVGPETASPFVSSQPREMRNVNDTRPPFAAFDAGNHRGIGGESGVSSEVASRDFGAADLVSGAVAGGAVPALPGSGLDERNALAGSFPASLCGRILVVDDQATNRDVLTRQLERQGHSIAAVPDGGAALRLLRAEAFDLVLLDLMMPVLDGFSTLVALKDDPALRHLPVIMISALDELGAVVRCIERGAEDFLPKPFNATLLRARIGAGLAKKRFLDQERAYLATIQAERATSERLLLNILPAPISARLKEGAATIVDSIPDATVLFADIVGFTRIASELPPAALVSRLNEIFSEFDHAAARLGLEKIKTIGDAYMVAGGVPVPLAKHAPLCAELALAMLDGVEAFGRRHGLELRIRIGIHSGPLVAGIIGTHKFSYDVWGDTVNVASRLEAHSQPGEILISAATRDRLAEGFVLEDCGEIELKNRGPLAVYRLTRKA